LEIHQKENIVLIGKLVKLIHLSQQTFVKNTQLVADHNDKGYGIIEDATGGEVYFSHEVVDSRYGFDDLRMGQQLEYMLENSPYLRAATVRIVPATESTPRVSL
jgi:cold shock CspA family protein